MEKPISYYSYPTTYEGEVTDPVKTVSPDKSFKNEVTDPFDIVDPHTGKSYTLHEWVDINFPKDHI